MYFRRKTADYFRSNFSSIQTLILRFGYLWKRLLRRLSRRWRLWGGRNTHARAHDLEETRREGSAELETARSLSQERSD